MGIPLGPLQVSARNILMDHALSERECPPTERKVASQDLIDCHCLDVKIPIDDHYSIIVTTLMDYLHVHCSLDRRS